MINLLPYNRRAIMKSFYKKRLLVVAFITFSIALFPLVLVLVALSYIENMDYKFLVTQYAELQKQSQNDGGAELSSKIKEINTQITSFQGGIKQAKIVSGDIEKASVLRPGDVKISGFNFSKKSEKNILSISGVSGTRDSVIKYGNLLDKKNGGICSDVSVPVTTYAKRIDVPFVITCEIEYATK